MRTPTKIAAFGTGLVVALALGAGLGAAVGPDVSAPDEEVPAPVGEGITSSAEGYRLVPDHATLEPEGGTFRFAIVDQEGEPARRFTIIHERELHLILVSRELTTFHHLHPTLDAGGTWSIDLPALEPGAYRAVADLQLTDGPRLALGTDLSVPGDYEPGRLPEPSLKSRVEGYDVVLAVEGDGGAITATLTVRREGDVVELEPYLGANGHLVAMRSGDLAYAHVHPVEGDEHEGVVSFDAELPSAGRYALFFDFKHGGTVRTATFTLDQGAATGTDEMEH